MAKKKNGILEEQRRAREEFLKLKKMQSGEIQVESSDSKQQYMTFGQRVENFWYHNKWYVIGLFAVVASIALMITQCATKKEYDLEIIYFSYSVALDEQTDKMAEYLSDFVTDINGDGEANVHIINCSFNDELPDRVHRDSVLRKVQANVMGNNKAIIYITDKESVKYFDLMNTTVPLFLDETFALSEDFYNASRLPEVSPLPDGLQMLVRNISGTIIEMEDDTETYYEESLKLIEKLQKLDKK